MEIISVNIQKGGCGKTTTVQAMAEILNAEYGKRVLCIDTDPQCNLTTISGVDVMDCQGHDLYALLHDECSLQECISHSKYYDLIPGSLLMAYADTEFNQIGKEYFLKEKLDPAAPEYDIILIDTPPALGLLNIMSLTASTRVLIPSECSFLSMVGLHQLYETIMTVCKYSNKDLSIAGILMVKYNSRANLNISVADGLIQMADRMGTKVFDAKIRETIKIREAQSKQVPLIDWDSKCSSLCDYRRFIKELF